MTKNSWATPARSYAAGIGDAVADRTINRKIVVDGTGATVAFEFNKLNPKTFDVQMREFAAQGGYSIRVEDWAEVAHRVAAGNVSLTPHNQDFEFTKLHHHLRQASVLMSGRHLQHGDETQSSRNQEVFTNCSTAASTFILFYLLLNGSGVGRSYDDDLMVVDWERSMPTVVPVVSPDHQDAQSGRIGAQFVSAGPIPGESLRLMVEDSREGWAKAIEKIELMAWEGKHAADTLVLDFSNVRPYGAPIAGMQNRPASGPGPLMDAIGKIAAIKNSGMSPWKATMHADHYSSECVLVGGARRAARMATKTWRDLSVFEFINIKNDGGLWSSNNSVTVDEEFWRAVKKAEELCRDSGNSNNLWVIDEAWRAGLLDSTERHAVLVFEAICRASYRDGTNGTGEPGIINVERLEQIDEGIEALLDGAYAESQRFKMDEATRRMTIQIATIFAAKPFKQITNPCGEISLSMLGGYCVIADVVPFHAASYQPGSAVPLYSLWDDDAEDAFRTAVRALIRVNTMDALYGKEVKRTNRIGVGFTGLHEYAWARFGLGWKDLVDEKKSIDFWRMMSRFSNACVDEAIVYASKLGMAIPHTVTTVKPAGTTSKLFGLTEGAHLPAMREYLRWVQFRNDDPLIERYVAQGYPVVRNLVTYPGTSIVGFPTVPLICSLGMGDALVTAAEATPEEQYEYLRLLEKWWIDGHIEGEGGHGFGNQVSYTLKYEPRVLGYSEFRKTLLEGQSGIRCCSVMPQVDTSSYEYQPEEPVSSERFIALQAGIKADDTLKEDIGIEHVGCGGACPVNFDEEEKTA